MADEEREQAPGGSGEPPVPDSESPVGSAGHLKPAASALEREARLDTQEKQGFSLFGIEMKITDDDNKELPWDGKTFGRLKVRGPAISAAYFHEDDPILDEDGFFDTGDVATIDAAGYMRITDRSKDVIKSGGEWISSIDIENTAMAHPAVAMAACVGMPHPKWDERPVVVVALKPGQQATREELLAYYDGKIAKWQTPDDVVFVDEIPLGSTGKMLKNKVRDLLGDYKLPDLR